MSEQITPKVEHGLKDPQKIDNGRYLMEFGLDAYRDGWDVNLNRPVGVKAAYGYNGRMLDREAIITAHSGDESEHIVKVFDIVGDHKETFMIMERLDPEDNIANRLDAGRDFTKEEIKTVSEQFPKAFAAMHRKEGDPGKLVRERIPVLHRDIKPSNLFFEDGQTLKVIDLGISRQTVDKQEYLADGLTGIGTEGYMAPEAIKGQDETEASNVFAQGVIMFELTTGKNPFIDYRNRDGAPLTSEELKAQPRQAVLQKNHSTPEFLRKIRKHLVSAAKEKEIANPEGYADIILKSLSDKPENRHQTPEEFSEALVATM